MWQLVATDLNQQVRAFLDDARGFSVTPRLNGYGEVGFDLDAKDTAALELGVAHRAIRAYQDGTLRFNGKVWEPLSRKSSGVSVAARGPLSEFLNRRVRALASYTATNNAGGPWDAGQIALDQLAAQNAIRNTFLAAGTRQASANRVRTYDPGTKMSDVIDADLAGAAGGFFFKERYVDNVAGALALLDLLYPAAGANHADARFEYGDGTLDNLLDYEEIEMNPLNRMTVASSASGGGRIAQPAEDAASILEYGLFEDETTYSDVSDTTLLLSQAIASVKATPPKTYSLSPGLEAPVLFRDFNVGDFVRLAIFHGSVNFEGWVRVLEATLDVDDIGTETLTEIKVELVVGDRLSIHPDVAYIEQRDEDRRRLEALERKVENIIATPSTPPASGGASDGSTDVSIPVDPTPPPPPPPPAPSDPPGVATSQAHAGWDDTGNGTPYVVVDGAVTPFGQSTVAEFEVVHDNGSNAPFTGDPNKILTPTVQITPADSNLHSYRLRIQNLTKGTKYWVRAKASNASGTNYGSWIVFTTPNVRAL